MFSFASMAAARARASSIAMPRAISGTAALAAASIEGIKLYCWKMKPIFSSRNSTSAVSSSA